MPYSEPHWKTLHRNQATRIKTEFKDCTVDAPSAPPEHPKTGVAITTAVLNIRKAPNRMAEKVQQVAAGTSLQFAPIVQKGERINNKSTWYKDPNGNYFWSGGVRTT